MISFDGKFSLKYIWHQILYSVSLPWNKQIKQFLLKILRVFSRSKHPNFSLNLDFLEAKTHAFFTKNSSCLRFATTFDSKIVYFTYVGNIIRNQNFRVIYTLSNKGMIFFSYFDTGQFSLIFLSQFCSIKRSHIVSRDHAEQHLIGCHHKRCRNERPSTFPDTFCDWRTKH